MDDRSTDEDESGSETDDSVVANSVESARTPSPSILGGLELLDFLMMFSKCLSDVKLLRITVRQLYSISFY